ncbi:MAG: hypothetical protein NW206_08015 [Hyphomonadaceae bacterium]|nr:hypothetical protein [Hyphomonadaceae bacterium]
MNGHNVLAIAVAAIAFYAIEFLIFAVAISPEQYQALTGYGSGDMSRMPFGAIPPILAAIGLSLAIKWRAKPGWMAGLMTGVFMGLCFAFATSFYGFVYGPNTAGFLAVDLAHYLICYGVAGAILGAWK